MKNDIVSEKSFKVAIKTVNIYKSLIYHQKEYVLSRQLLKSGTSIGANIRGAENGESKVDFIHKMGIALKECSETMYWLELLKATNFIHDENYNTIYNDLTELLEIIRRTITTAKQNLCNS